MEKTIDLVNKIYSPFDLPPRYPTVNNKPSKTVQSAEGETNINQIMAKVKRGQMPPIHSGQGRYMDATQVLSYQEMCDEVNRVQNEFLQLPAEIKKRFHQDPAELVEFLDDPENREEAIRIGLIDKPAPPPPEAVGVPKTGAEAPKTAV